MKAFRVTAIFHSGMYEFDNSLVYTSIPALQEFLGLGQRVTGLEVEIKDIYGAAELAEVIQKEAGPALLHQELDADEPQPVCGPEA